MCVDVAVLATPGNINSGKCFQVACGEWERIQVISMKRL